MKKTAILLLGILFGAMVLAGCGGPKEEVAPAPPQNMPGAGDGAAK